MQWQLTFNSLILGTGTVLALMIALIMRTRRAAPGSRYVSRLLFGVAIWTAADAFESAALLIPHKISFAKLAYLGIASVPMLWFLFTLEFSQRGERLKRRDRLLLWIIPLTTILLVATNEWHHLVWSEIVPVGPEPGAELIYYHGAWFWLAVAFTYILLATGTLTLIRTIWHFPRQYRWQSAILLLAVALPWAGNLVYLTGWSPSPGLDPTSVAFLVSGIVFAVGLTRYHILDLIPVARGALIEAMRDAVLVLDIHRRIVDLNPAARQLFGIDVNAAIGQPVEGILGDWPELARRIRVSLEVSGEVHSGEKPPRVLDVQGMLLEVDRDSPGGALLLLRDITAAKQAEVKMRRVQAFNEQILQQVNEGIVVEGAGGLLLFVNPAAAAMLSYRPEELVGRHWHTIVVPDYYPIVEEANARRRRGIADRYEIELVDREGGHVAVQVTGSAQIDSETGAQVGTLAVFVDRTEQKRTERELQEANRQLQAQLAATEALQVVMREQAIRDSLTGLYNRRYLEETLEREVARAVRAKQPISIVMVDIDHFKQLNDVYGHQAGDRVLRALGDVLQAHSRRDDIACRFGGEEFVVMLAGTPLDVAVKRAEEWRYVFQETEVPYSPRSLHATLSAGIAAFPVHGKSGVALLQRADQALYQAKAEGRNRVSVLNVSDPATHP